MKLLFDENLSDRLVPLLADVFPGSAHVKGEGLMQADDSRVWDHAKAAGFIVVSKDSDFHQRSLVFGHPPKFIYVKAGNSPTTTISALLRTNAVRIHHFAQDPTASVLVLS